MATFDWASAAVVLLSLLIGAWRGLVYEVLSVVSWVVAFLTAQWLAADVAPQLPLGDVPEAVRYAAGFLLVFAVNFTLSGWRQSTELPSHTGPVFV